jgi:hypothetical protein
MGDDDEVTRPGMPTRAERAERRASMNALKMHVPVSMVITIVTMALGLSGAWWKLSAHADSKTVHLNEAAVIEGGGVAYKGDVQRLQREFEARLRRMLYGTKITCRFTKGSLESVCSLTLPESE